MLKDKYIMTYGDPEEPFITVFNGLLWEYILIEKRLLKDA